jgi:hypothetical protein
MDVVYGYQILSQASIGVDTVRYLQKYEFCAVEITFLCYPKLINAHGEALAYKSHSCKSPADIVVYRVFVSCLVLVISSAQDTAYDFQPQYDVRIFVLPKQFTLLR